MLLQLQLACCCSSKQAPASPCSLRCFRYFLSLRIGSGHFGKNEDGDCDEDDDDDDGDDDDDDDDDDAACSAIKSKLGWTVVGSVTQRSDNVSIAS